MFFEIVATLGIITLTIPAFLALVENDIKRIIAYSTVSQMGYIVYSLGIGTVLGVAGALFHVINHALLKSMLFLAAGAVIYATGTRNIRELGGLAYKMPITAAAVLIGGLSVAGLPPLNGFASKLLIYEAGFERAFHDPTFIGRLYLLYTVIAIFVGAVTLLYFMRLFYSVFLGMPSKLTEKAKDPPIAMKASLILLMVISVVFGIFPQIPVGFIVKPALTYMFPKAILPLNISYFGYSTNVGFYTATLLTIILLVTAGISYAIYVSGKKLYEKVTLTPHVVRELHEFKYEVFTGGEYGGELLPLEELKVTPEEFNYALKESFSSLYSFSKEGGIEGVISYMFHEFLDKMKNLDIVKYVRVSSYVLIYVFFFATILFLALVM
ncbi:MAG: hypothetical protein B6U76_05605 [Desulfurococcales archaeon ex4484_217_2]|nr:MAG: hypothetical protein B6U76_05605 [Desulfurococcales archaeon ex4484_217_2]